MLGGMPLRSFLAGLVAVACSVGGGVAWPAYAAAGSAVRGMAAARPGQMEAGAAHGAAAAGAADASGAETAIPTPPVPPRIAQGPDYEKCLAMLGTDPEQARRFADAWVATGGGAGAAHCLALAMVTLGQQAAGADMLDQLAGKSRASAAARASVYAQAGQAWLLAGDAQRALGSTTLALSLTPDDADLLIDRSVAEGTLERYGETIEDLDAALKIDPRRADALVFRAAAHRQLKQFGLAQEDLGRALAISPDDADALLERGLLRQARGDVDGARGDWQRAAALAPGTATGELAQQNLDRLKAGRAPE